MQRSETIIAYRGLQHKLAAYLDNNIREPFGISQLAGHLNISYFHLTDIFQSMRGESLGRYITRTRLEKAAVLSAYSNLNLSEIADATGFATKYSLSKAFTYHFGYSAATAKKNILRTDSINAIMDGIASEAAYRSILQSDFSYTCTTQTLANAVLAGYTWQVGASPVQYEQSMPYLHDLLSISVNGKARRCIKAFDSVNFSPLHSYREFYGVLCDERSVNPADFDGMVLAVPCGTYLVFDVPAGNREIIKHSITYFRESLVWYKKMFTLGGFYDFFLLHDGPDAGGEYYLFTGS